MEAPGPREWAKAIRKGFRPNGATWAPDRICGIRVGIKNSSFEYSTLPANRHDYDYWLLGGGTWRDRLDADIRFYRALLDRCSVLGGWQGWKARRRCLLYFLAVRLIGGFGAFWHD
jgi:hypothetical protein